METLRLAALEAGKVLDELTSIRLDLECQSRHAGPERRALSDAKLHSVCVAIDHAVDALKRILTAAQQARSEPIVPASNPRDEA